jgi:beta-xylosidase
VNTLPEASSLPTNSSELASHVSAQAPVGRRAGETTYLNPVYRASCPDPFVLKFRGEYWCYSTGFSGESRVFGVLHSRDLVNWRAVGGAMEALPGGHTC